MRTEKTKFLCNGKPQLLEKFSLEKAENIFCKLVPINGPLSTFQKISILNIYDGAKKIYPKKQKKILRKDLLISEAVFWRCSVKKKKKEKIQKKTVQVFSCEFCEICNHNVFVNISEGLLLGFFC